MRMQILDQNRRTNPSKNFLDKVAKEWGQVAMALIIY